MKDFIKKCPVFLTLAVSGLLFSLTGIIGRLSIYKDYEFSVVERPFLALVMEGMSKGTMPWEVAEGIGMEENEFPGGLFYRLGNAGGGQNIGEVPDVETLAGESAANGGNGGENSGISGEEGSGAAFGKGETADGGNGTDGRNMDGVQDVPASQEVLEGQNAPEDGRTYDFQTVTEDYFDDAVFIGDSRTVGLLEYGGMEERADFYAKISLTIYDLFTEELARNGEPGKKMTVEEALMEKEYGKVYLMLGINELGTGTTDTFLKEYEKVVGRIRELQPDAVIFVQGIMKVTGTKDAEDPIFNNTNIEEKNAAIAGLADNRNIFYIDVNEVVCDGEGNLNEEYTIDEVHLKAKNYEIWKQFLLGHGIVR